MVAITICGDLGAPQNKVSHCFHCFPIYLPWRYWARLPWSCLSIDYFYIDFLSHIFSLVQCLSRVWLFVTPWTAARQTFLSITNSRIYSNACPLSQWCHPTISLSVVPFCSLLQSFSASGSFQMSQFFASGGQSIGVSASTSVLPMNIHDWFPLWWSAWISLQSKGPSRVFSNTTGQKHQFFSTQLSL